MEQKEKLTAFESMLQAALAIPGTFVDREDFIKQELKDVCSAKQITEACKNSPAAAGIQEKTISKVVDRNIGFHTGLVCSASFLSGLPGGLALFGTVPADLIQYFVQLIMLIQKEAYLYGWKFKLTADKKGRPDEKTLRLLTIMMGVMFKDTEADELISKLSEADCRMTAELNEDATLPSVITDTALKEIEQGIEFKLFSDTFIKGSAKILPVLGGVLNGGLAFLSFRPMAERLALKLSKLKWADYSFYHVTYSVVK